MAHFLHSHANGDGNSSAAIKKVLAGTDVRVAVAFLGHGAEEEVPEGAKLICDIGMGGTSPDALKKLSEKLGDNLKYLKDFHAKIFISNECCVVGSANLSNRGVGFLSQAKLTEAAVQLSASTETKDVVGWFEAIWKKAKVVDKGAIAAATLRWKANKRGKPKDYDGNARDLYDALVDDDRGFEDWKFILTTMNPTLEKDAKKKTGNVIQAFNEEAEVEHKILDSSVLPYTGLQDEDGLGGYYIGIHAGIKSALYVRHMLYLGRRECPHPKAHKREQGKTKTVFYFAELPWDRSMAPSVEGLSKERKSELYRIIRGVKPKHTGAALDLQMLQKALRATVERLSRQQTY